MRNFLILLALFSLIACQPKNETKSSEKWTEQNPRPLPAEPYAMNSEPLLIKGAKVMTAEGDIFTRANILMEKGLIKKISQEDITAPQARVIEGDGLVVTPGIIDVHSHMGVYPHPWVSAHSDGNESSRPVTADVWAEHAFWPQDPSLWRALAGGITTIQVLPGSANLVGGRSFTAKLIPEVSARSMRFPGAPQGVKMACGENPKRVYSEKGIKTRMGNVAGYRKAFQEALEYKRDWDEFTKGSKDKKDKPGKIPKRNFVHETLMKILEGEILLHFHCYRADDISNILDVAQEFGFKIRTVHHGLEAYKIAPRLAKEDVATATWADWWGFKIEAYDGVPQNAALLTHNGAKAIIHSDSPTDVQFLNLEAGKAMMAGRKMGLKISEDQALKWVTLNAAWALGLEDRIGSIKEGKMADLVIWDGHPFSVFTKTRYVIINGNVVLDRAKKERPRSDFEIGVLDMAFNDGRDFHPPKTSADLNFPQDDYSSFIKPPSDMDYTLIENVKIFSQGKWLENQSLLFSAKDQKIHKIESGAIKEIPANTRRIDGQGKLLTAGLIESATDLGLVEIPMEDLANDSYVKSDVATPGNYAYDSLNLMSVRIPITRAEGVTTALSYPGGNLIGGTGVAFDLGETEPYIKTPTALYGSISKGKEARSMNWRTLRILMDEATRWHKNKENLISGKTLNLQHNPVDLKAMEPFLKGDIPWVIHVEQANEIKNLLDWYQATSKKFPIKIILWGASEAWLHAKEIAKLNIPVIINPIEQDPNLFTKLRARKDLAAYLADAGVPLIFSAGGDGFTRRLRQQAGFAVKYGMDPEQALLAITQTPAQVFAVEGGDILEGKTANLVLWSGDPLEPTQFAEKVWIRGRSQNLDNRQWDLAEKYYKLYN
ncbi:MAG: amidohydrolase family protein [Bdellovibrionales bacterium]|nr:amidohydrolase family protein [Bdellovibrionales bacterium]